jgi:hypothetical protein
MELPQAYITNKFHYYSAAIRETSSYLNGSCPICKEGDSWGKKRRLFYFKNDDYFYCHNCFSGDVKILTLEYGPIEFRKIKDLWVTIRCKDGVWRKRQILSYGYQDVFEYQFGNLGFSPKRYNIKATENHKWFIKRDNKRRRYDTTTSLKLGDRLDNTPTITERDVDGIVHGIIFGDGTYRKYKGEKRYAIIRVCKQDSRKEEILKILKIAGYNITYPKNLKGDAYVNIGRVANLKDVPNTTNPNYIAGFIYGLWLTDGNANKQYEIATVRTDLVEWLNTFAAMGGYRIVNNTQSHTRKNCYANAKPIYRINLKTNSDIILRNKRYVGIEEVYCLEEFTTGGFFLDGNIITGNCNRSWTPYFWIKEVTGLSFKEICSELKDYDYDSKYKLIVDKVEERVFDLPTLPGECVNLKDSLQIEYFKNYPVVNIALDVCNERRLFSALNAPKTYYVCLNDRFHGNRLIIPFYDNHGKIESYISRKLLDSDNKAKYLIKFGSDKPIFNLDKVDENYPYIFIFEGQIDCMFVKNGVSVAGTRLTESQEETLLRLFPFHQLVWVLDNYTLEGSEVRKIIEDKFKNNQTVFLFENGFSKFKDFNDYCVEKKQDQIDPALILQHSYKGSAGLVRL